MRPRFLRFILPALVLLLAQAACALPANTAVNQTLPTATLLPASGSNPLGGTDNPAFCPANNLMAPKPSGLIDAVTTAHGVEGDNKTAVEPSDIFSPGDIVHAVVSVKDAPLGTRFKATWKVVDIGDPSTCNTVLAEYDVETDGTRNIDFSLTPDSNLPAGSYKVEIAVNGTLDKIAFFTVQ